MKVLLYLISTWYNCCALRNNTLSIHLFWGRKKKAKLNCRYTVQRRRRRLVKGRSFLDLGHSLLANVRINRVRGFFVYYYIFFFFYLNLATWLVELCSCRWTGHEYLRTSWWAVLVLSYLFPHLCQSCGALCHFLCLCLRLCQCSSRWKPERKVVV